MTFVLIGSVCAAELDADDMQAMAESNNDEIVNVENDLNVISENDETDYSDLRNEMDSFSDVNQASGNQDYLSDGESGTYSDLISEIGSGGDISLTKKEYRYADGDGDTIRITTSGVINGNGAVIDMAGSNKRAFYVTALGVTIKNLTIKNANYNGKGGAIHFSESGSVENCNFTNNSASEWGGAVYIWLNGAVSNCNFNNNFASSFGGAISMVTGAVSNCNFNNNSASEGGAVDFYNSGTVTNCSFTNNQATRDTGWGGAVWIYSNGDVINCNFTNNKANRGGAVYITDSTVTTCNFINNSASEWGGAYMGSGTVTNCSFTNNHATDANSQGGAIRMSAGSVENCHFDNNSASLGGAIVSVQWKTVTADTCIFKTDSDTTFNTNNLPPILTVDDFITMYGSRDKLTFGLKTNTNSLPVYYGNISISIYFKNNDSWVCNYSCLSGEGWDVDLPVGSYYAIFDTDYDEFQPINRTITVNKASTEIIASALTTVFNVNKYLIVTLKDANGNPVSGACITVDLKGAKNYTTDNKGQVKVSTKGLALKAYTANITFNGNAVYAKSTKSVKVTVKKATPKLTAKNKTFKLKVKVKKYKITLKTNLGKVMKSVKVTLKVKGKTYWAKTNYKGVATFKIKNLKKKGKYTAVIKYAGNKYYNKLTKKVKITVKK